MHAVRRIGWLNNPCPLIPKPCTLIPNPEPSSPNAERRTNVLDLSGMDLRAVPSEVNQVLPRPPSEWGQILSIQTLDLYRSSPDSGDLQYESEGLGKRICGG